MKRKVLKTVLFCLGLFGLMVAFAGNGGDDYGQYYTLFSQEEVVITDAPNPLLIWTGLGMMFLAALVNFFYNLLSVRHQLY